MHTVKITPNLLFEYQCTNLSDCRIESKKNYSVARIESTLFARIGMLCCTANQQSAKLLLGKHVNMASQNCVA